MNTMTPLVDVQVLSACTPAHTPARVRSGLLAGSGLLLGSAAAFGGAIAPVVGSERGTGLSAPSADDSTGLPPRGAPV